jgi:hypothetical protein
LSTHNGEASTVDIKNNADTCSSGSAQNSIYKLANLKLIARSDGGSGGGSKSKYKLTNAGEAYIVDNPEQVKAVGKSNPVLEIR